MELTQIQNWEINFRDVLLFCNKMLMETQPLTPDIIFPITSSTFTMLC